MKLKQETLEEAAEIHSTKMWGIYYDDNHPDIAITQTQGEISVCDFIAGAKWQQERSYSEEEVLELLRKAHFVEQNIDEWFEQFKKK